MPFKRLLASLLLILVPLTAQAAATLTVEQPVIAGLGTQVQGTGLPPGQSLDLSVQGRLGEILIPVHSDENGTVRAEIRAEELQRAGDYTLTMEQAGKTIAGPRSFTVLPDSVDLRASTVRTSPVRTAGPGGHAAVRPDGRDEVDVLVHLQDRYGNPLPGRPATLVSGRSADTVSPQGSQTNAQGDLHFLISTSLPGQIRLRAIDLLSGNTLAATAEIVAEEPGMGGYDPGPTYDRTPRPSPLTAATTGQRLYYAQTTGGDIIDHFVIDLPESTPPQVEVPLITIRAVDRSGQTIEDYVGTIAFSSSDPNAVLPNFGRYTYKERDLGTKGFPLVLKFDRGGQQTLRVEDSNDPSIFGEATIMVEGHGASGEQIQVTSPQNGAFVNSTDIIVTGIGPKFANLVVMGGLSDVLGATDKDGNFSIPISLNPQKKEFTLRVRDDAGRSDSGPIDVAFDRDPPRIGAITFSPEKPKPGDNVLVVVQSDADIDRMTMRLGGMGANAQQEISLMQNPSASGSYQAFFPAPEAGAYQPVIAATDKAGNTVEVRATLMIGQAGLPRVQGVHGEPGLSAVTLEWTPLEENVDGYRIYVGESPDDFDHNLDTGRATTKVTVAGLTPGHTYYLAVTALKDGRESGEKSEVVSVLVPGLVIKTTPGNGKILLEWLPPKVPLQSYKLEYGVKEGVYTETRMIVADKDATGPQAYAIGDLLSGIPYFLRLTPVTVTGEVLTDMAAVFQATPIGEGFEPLHSEGLPFVPGAASLPHTPHNPATGVPMMAWVGAALAAAGTALYQWNRRRNLRQTAAFLAAAQSRYHR